MHRLARRLITSPVASPARVQTRTVIRQALDQLEDDRATLDSSHPSSYLSKPRTVSVVGAPMSWGQPKGGTELGPDALRSNGLESAVMRLGWNYNDLGDVSMDSESLLNDEADVQCPGAKNCLKIGRANMHLHTRVKGAAAKRHFVLTLGGDHSLAIGSTAGLLTQYPDLGVLWVDAHADINTPEMSKSGNMHGMPLAFLMKLMGEDTTLMPGFEWLKDIPTLQPEQVAYVGLRDVDERERSMLRSMREKGMFVSTMQDVDGYGIGQVVRNALKSLGTSRPLHLSYDIDALDPTLAPSTGTVVRGGLTYREGHFVAEAAAETGQLVGMDIVEVNPNLQSKDEADMTAQMALVLTASALGSRIL